MNMTYFENKIIKTYRKGTICQNLLITLKICCFIDFQSSSIGFHSTCVLPYSNKKKSASLNELFFLIIGARSFLSYYACVGRRPLSPLIILNHERTGWTKLRQKDNGYENKIYLLIFDVISYII